MSKSKHSDDRVVSTAEAIRMASASILGTTTSQDIALGSATGSGTKLEENSRIVAMGVVPLVSAFSQKLHDKTNVELISLEWDLGSGSSSEILPEHLIVCAGGADSFTTHTCAISWEKGVVDPFRLNSYLHRLSAKMKQVEDAILSNQLDYEKEGMSVLRQFCDRFNLVTFVEMLDRRFQESWDSKKIQQDDVDLLTSLAAGIRTDYSTVPPGLTLTGGMSFTFDNPSASENQILEHLRNRIISPVSLDSLVQGITELGQAIIAEINTYAYSTEEVDITRATIAMLVKYLGTDSVPISNLDMVASRIHDFGLMIQSIMNTFSDITEAHIRSGESLTTHGHKKKIVEHMEASTLKENELQKAYAKVLIEHLVSSIEKEISFDGPYRAWMLRSIITYFNYMAKRVHSFFEEELSNYIAARAVKESMYKALRSFEGDVNPDGMASEDFRVFEEFQKALTNQIDRTVDRKSYEGDAEIEHLLRIASDEIRDEFQKINIWDLIDFADVAEVTRNEIAAMRENSGEYETVDPSQISQLLTRYENLETEIIPHLAEHILSKESILKLTSSTREDFLRILNVVVQSQDDMPEEWYAEAKRWIDRIDVLISNDAPVSERMKISIETIFSELMEGSKAASIIDRVRKEADLRENEYAQVVDEWKAECKRIEDDNIPIRKHNREREEMKKNAREQYEKETHAYEAKLVEYNSRASDEADSYAVQKPQEPDSLENRLVRIDEQYPHKKEIPLPPKPETPEITKQYSVLAALLDDIVSKLRKSQGQMQDRFLNELSNLQQQAEQAYENITIRVDTEFLEYLMDSKIRRLSRAVATPIRAYLRNTINPDILYLVKYSFSENEFLVEIGNNLLKG
ncbi:hypothetical protein EU537_09350 [Candidatus Thorarchaeota archaeon]|nr:MAG: hypothetical protein EU537_09350 [Candidatus Thorarchaeota archaeon]